MSHTPLKDLFCAKPFEYFDVHLRDRNLRLYCCCPTWLPEFVKAENYDEISNLWNSQKMQEIRASILDGSFRYCDKNLCPEIQSQTLWERKHIDDPYLKQIIDENITELPRGPKEINFSEDRTCNLTCPSCRSSVISMKDHELKHVEYFHQEVLPSFLKDSEWLDICSAGDPFASSIYKRLLYNLNGAEYPNLNINIITIVILLT